MPDITLCRCKMLKRSFSLLVLAIFLLPLVPFNSAQDSPLPGVNLNCESDPEMNVHPLNYEPIDLICTIENTSSAEETIEISNEFEGGSAVQIQGASDEYTVAGGETEEFTVTFSGETKIPSSSSFDFEIFATVTKYQGVDLPEFLPEFVQTNASASGTLEIGTYGIVELRIPDTSTRALEPSGEVTINLQFTNRGNDQDRIEVRIKNQIELEGLGFSFPESSFVAETLAIDATSPVREILVRAPADVENKINTNIQFEAKSTNDLDAASSEISIPLSVETSSSSGTLSGLSEDSQDDLVLYGAIGGAVIVFFILVGIITRSVKKKSKGSSAEDATIEIADQDEDKDDLDDLFDDLDDFDDVGDSTNVRVSEDEFDDLLDDFV